MNEVLKRTFDVVVAFVLLLLLSPLLLLLIVLVRLKLGAPVFFSQERPGLGARPFRLIKFRTMNERRDESGDLLPDDRRLTGLGKFLRSTSLDELPELVNVLKGDMSLVGPRPLLMHYLELYSPHQMRRHEIRPGITGWAQVHGRNNLPWEQRFEHDVWYVDHRTFWLDLRILWMTLLQVLKRSDISQDGHATMAEFTGRPEAM